MTEWRLLTREHGCGHLQLVLLTGPEARTAPEWTPEPCRDCSPPPKERRRRKERER